MLSLVFSSAKSFIDTSVFSIFHSSQNNTLAATHVSIIVVEFRSSSIYSLCTLGGFIANFILNFSKVASSLLNLFLLRQRFHIFIHLSFDNSTLKDLATVLHVSWARFLVSSNNTDGEYGDFLGNITAKLSTHLLESSIILFGWFSVEYILINSTL